METISVRQPTWEELQPSCTDANGQAFRMGFYNMLVQLGVSYTGHAEAVQRELGGMVVPPEDVCSEEFIYNLLQWGYERGLDPFGFSRRIFNLLTGTGFDEPVPESCYFGIHAARIFAIIVDREREDEIMEGLMEQAQN